MTSHRRFNLFGNLLHFHRFSRETNGQFCLVEAVVAPGAGAPLNRHPGEEEAFVVLEGRFEFILEGESREAGPGEFVTIPSGAKHAFVNRGEAPGRLAIFNSPGKVHDQFFSEAGDPVAEDSWDMPPPAAPDIPKVMAVAAGAGVEIFPPEG